VNESLRIAFNYSSVRAVTISAVTISLVRIFTDCFCLMIAFFSGEMVIIGTVLVFCPPFG